MLVAACLLTILATAGLLSAQTARTTPSASSAVVDVDLSQKQGPVSPLLLGHNVNWLRTDNTADAAGRTYPSVAGLLRPLQVPWVRFPGGLHANCYDWEAGVTRYDASGNQLPRPANLAYDFGTFQCTAGSVVQFGTDEFMEQLAQIGDQRPAEALITVNVCGKQAGGAAGVTACGPVGSPPTGTPICPNPAAGNCPGAAQAANWVSYLNGTDPNNPWVQLRQRNGRAEPYNVGWFELGNEVDHLKLDTAAYRAVIAAYVPAMRAASPVPIRIGAVQADAWDTELARDGHIDFLSTHLYGPRTDEHTALLRAPGAGSERSQRWPLTVPSSGGPFQFQASVYPNCARIAPFIDGNALAFIAEKTAGANASRCAWEVGSLTSGAKTLTLQTRNRSWAQVSLAGLCANGSSMSECRTPAQVDLDPYKDNPLAIAVVRPPAPSVISTISRGFAARTSGPIAVEVHAFGSPTYSGTDAQGNKIPQCPNLSIDVAGHVQSVSLAGGPASNPCFSIFAPKVIKLSFTPRTSARVVSFAYRPGPGGADVNVVKMVVAGETLRLGPYAARPGLPNGQFYAAALTAGQKLDAIRRSIDLSGRPGVGIVVSEWSQSSALYSPPSWHLPDNLRAALQDALFVQQMMKRHITGANFYTINGAYWHVFHCLSSTQFDPPGACGRADAAPYLSVPGHMFQMLAGRLGDTLVKTQVQTPIIKVPENITADYRILQPAQDVPEVNAVATTSPGSLNVHLLNLGSSPAKVTVRLANATLAGSPATLTSLTGGIDDVNGCKTFFATVCTPKQVASVARAISAAATMSLDLPANSFAVLAVPLKVFPGVASASSQTTATQAPKGPGGQGTTQTLDTPPGSPVPSPSPTPDGLNVGVGIGPLSSELWLSGEEIRIKAKAGELSGIEARLPLKPP